MGNALNRIEEQHRNLRQTLEELEEASDPKQIAILLDRVNTQLADHFAEEEAPDGFALTIANTLPQNQTRLDQIFEEHADFLNRMSLLKRQIEEIQLSLATVRDELKYLCNDLRLHEERETRLVTDAVFTDVGPGD